MQYYKKLGLNENTEVHTIITKKTKAFNEVEALQEVREAILQWTSLLFIYVHSFSSPYMLLLAI